MGDSQRNIKFAQFIHKNFNKIKNVLVVADGKGELSRKLANKKYNVIAIENKPRFQGRNHKGIVYKRGWFTAETVVDADLIVGMHPDEATGEIVEWARKNRKPFAVVPCCVMGRHSSGVHNYYEWLKKLKQIGGGREARLKISGKNIIIYSTDKKRDR